jgi:hypothetical protein
VKDLRLVAALTALTPDEKVRLNVVTDSPSAEAVDIGNALALLGRTPA